jgi:Flp pilus assembly protein TadG
MGDREEEGLSVAFEVQNSKRRRRDERGATLVEFAIASVVLLVLLFGIIEYGYVLSLKQGLTQAAAEGARVGAVGGDPAAIAAAVNKAVGGFDQACNTGGLTCGDDKGRWTTTTPAGPLASACGSYTCITIEVSYDWKNHPLLPKFPGLGLILPDTLKSTSVARVS